ncbi:hypothetical protein BCR33DRAFT_468062 [Rhizoclosmatium globosum]|uniref:Uncharacterized protein n=1 Tax=Rhizoclosmatium globosum TaxID=329046 RepID=A0A1Y2BQJ0_9FUNG|nr:hypothetical protein BCR33DRAFT_468062 [Rhizoclosmatium globosum]|eukprot:ORY37006.1 hypothetical protein BCR33DRAFT_468062 [Rhizoclosmatium globosum]
MPEQSEGASVYENWNQNRSRIPIPSLHRLKFMNCNNLHPHNQLHLQLNQLLQLHSSHTFSVYTRTISHRPIQLMHQQQTQMYMMLMQRQCEMMLALANPATASTTGMPAAQSTPLLPSLFGAMNAAPPTQVASVGTSLGKDVSGNISTASASSSTQTGTAMCSIGTNTSLVFDESMLGNREQNLTRNHPFNFYHHHHDTEQPIVDPKPDRISKYHRLQLTLPQVCTSSQTHQPQRLFPIHLENHRVSFRRRIQEQTINRFTRLIPSRFSLLTRR